MLVVPLWKVLITVFQRGTSLLTTNVFGFYLNDVGVKSVVDTSVIWCLDWVSWELQNSPEPSLTPLYTWWCLMPTWSTRWLWGPWFPYLPARSQTKTLGWSGLLAPRLPGPPLLFLIGRREVAGSLVVSRSGDLWRHDETAGVIMQWADGAEPGRPCVMSGQPRVAVTESNTPPHKQNYTADSRANCGACQWSSQSPTSDTPSVC